MKRTPEQKAWFEYGKALKALRIFNLDFCAKEQTMAEFRRELVLKAWQKRAVCREWLPPEERECTNCKYDKLLRNKYPCSHCFPNDWENPFWEPRKEGE